jgi:predicted nucleotidyltransferase
MSAKKRTIALIHKYIRACMEKNIRINKVILFGSQVSGKTDKYSDIDIVLVSDQFTEDSYQNWKMFVPINVKFVDIEPHPYPTHYFIKNDPFIEEIKKIGIEITF